MEKELLDYLVESLQDGDITKEQYVLTKRKIESKEISTLQELNEEVKELIITTSIAKAQAEQAMLFLEDNGSISKLNKKKYDVLDGIPVNKKSKAPLIIKIVSGLIFLGAAAYGATILFNPNPIAPADGASYDPATSPYEMYDNEIERCWINSYLQGKAEPSDCGVGLHEYEVVQKGSCSVQDLESNTFLTIKSRYGNDYCIKYTLNDGAGLVN